MSARNRELLNLIVVGVLTGIGFGSVYIARQAVVSTESLSYAAFFIALYLVAHVVARLTVPAADPYLLPMAALLTAIGLTEIYRLEPDDAFRQGLWVVLGVTLFSATLLFLRRDYRRLESYKYVIGLAAIALLALPALPEIGREVNGARLWVKIGSFQFQPGEFAKILLIVFLAGYLREKREVLAQGRLKDFGPLLLIWGGAMLVLIQTNDLGSGLLYFGVFLAMLYVATARAWYVAAGAALFVAGAVGVYQIVPRVQERVSVWLDPWSKSQDEGYQLVQSLFSISNGGFGGTGFGRGTFSTSGGDPLIPFLNTDFATMSSFNMSVDDAYRLAMRVNQQLAREEVAGVVVTHGTDTMEESCWLAELLLASDKPAVFTGAQRSHDDPLPDGPRNLLSSVRTAACPAVRGLGAVICFADRIHAARDVTKLSASALATFQSYDQGALGEVDGERVIVHRRPTLRRSFALERLETRVPLIRLHLGFDVGAVEVALERGAQGLVIEAFGRGNGPAGLVPVVRDAVAAGTPVVVTSRCPTGRVEPIYGKGGGKDLLDAGATFAGDLKGPKARLLLMVLLSSLETKERIGEVFRELAP